MDFSILVSYDLLPWQWFMWVLLGIVIGLTKTGFSGTAAAMMPVIALIFGARETTGIVLPLLCFADFLTVLYYHRHAEWKYILKLLPWTLAGFGAALFTDHLVPHQSFRYLMGGSILVGLIVMAWSDFRRQGMPPPSTWWFSGLFGMAAGFASIMGNVAGPLMAVFFLSMQLPKNSFVGTTAWYFLITNYLKLPIMIFFWKNITAKTLVLDLTLLPVIIAGAVLGIVLIKKISEPFFRKVIMLLTLMATILLFI